MSEVLSHPDRRLNSKQMTVTHGGEILQRGKML